MNLDIVNELKNLTEEDLLSLQEKVSEHIKYLKESIISLEDESNGGDVDNEQS